MTDTVPVQLDLFNNQEHRDLLFNLTWNDVSESEIIFCKCEGRSHSTSARIHRENRTGVQYTM